MTVGGTAVAILLVFLEMLAYILKKSVRHKKPFWIEVREEFKFYFKCRGLVKPVRYLEHTANESRSPMTGENRIEQLPDKRGSEQKDEDINYEFLPDIANMKS